MASSQDAIAVYVELSAAIGQLQARGLHQSVKWAAEQLVGLPEEAWELGAAQAAKAAAQQQEPQHPRLVQGRNFFELKVWCGATAIPCARRCRQPKQWCLSPSLGRQPAGPGGIRHICTCLDSPQPWLRRRAHALPSRSVMLAEGGN